METGKVHGVDEGWDHEKDPPKEPTIDGVEMASETTEKRKIFALIGEDGDIFVFPQTKTKEMKTMSVTDDKGNPVKVNFIKQDEMDCYDDVFHLMKAVNEGKA